MRPLGKTARVRFRYHLDGADTLQVAIVHAGKRTLTSVVNGLKKGEWSETTVEFDNLPAKFTEANELHFVLPKGAVLTIDDVLLY